MQVAFINKNPVLRMGSHHVDNTRSMAMATTAISNTNTGRIY